LEKIKMNLPVYKDPAPPLTTADVDRLIDMRIAEHERSAWGASLAGGLLCIGMGVLLGVVL
jgi:hypothetical protein